MVRWFKVLTIASEHAFRLRLHSTGIAPFQIPQGSRSWTDFQRVLDLRLVSCTPTDLERMAPCRAQLKVPPLSLNVYLPGCPDDDSERTTPLTRSGGQRSDKRTLKPPPYQQDGGELGSGPDPLSILLARDHHMKPVKKIGLSNISYLSLHVLSSRPSARDTPRTRPSPSQSWTL